MNWPIIKRKYPYTHDILKRAYKEWEGISDDDFMRKFLYDKGYDVGLTWINSLRQFEKDAKANAISLREETERQDKEIEEMGYYTEDGLRYSGCCGAIVYDDTDICSDCKEHI